MTDDEIDRRIPSLFARMNRLGAKMSGSTAHRDSKGPMTDKSPKTKAELEAFFWSSCARHRNAAVESTSWDDYPSGATWEVASSIWAHPRRKFDIAPT